MCSDEKPEPTRCNPKLKSSIDSIELCKEEIEAAIFEFKLRRYFKEKHKDYWAEQELIRKTKKK
jgi:hypothetical protein